MKVEVRDSVPSDRAHLIRCLDAMHDRMVQIDPWNRLQRTADHGPLVLAKLRREVRKHSGFILVAEADGRAAAAAVAYVRPYSREEQTAERPTKMGFLADLSVLPEWQGLGIGTKLIHEVESRFRRAGCDLMGLAVFVPNRGAQRLYRRVGFTPEGMFLVKRVGSPPKRWPATPRSGRRQRHRSE